jgi:hypothetical protein
VLAYFDMAKATCVLWLGCTMAFGCAPSHRMVHEGNVYFERCYGADFEAKVPAQQREACWTAWLAHYTRHQPSHRVDYAMRRIENIQAGESTLELPGLKGGQNKPSMDPKVGKVAHGEHAFAVVQEPADAGPEILKHGCSEVCDGYEAQCAMACPRDLVSCHNVCARENKICRAGCY